MRLLLHALSQMLSTELTLKKYAEDFPGGPVVKNLHSNAGFKGLIPSLGRFHMPREACAPQQLKPMLHNKKSHHNEKPTQAMKSSSHLLQLEKAHMQQ